MCKNWVFALALGVGLSFGANFISINQAEAKNSCRKCTSGYGCYDSVFRRAPKVKAASKYAYNLVVACSKGQFKRGSINRTQTRKHLRNLASEIRSGNKTCDLEKRDVAKGVLKSLKNGRNKCQFANWQ